jgi:hypothetical protein
MNAKVLVPGIITILLILGILFLNLNKSNQTTDKESAITSIIAYNQTQGADAITVEANKGDLIVYTLTAENPTKDLIESFKLETSIEDLAELATLIDAQGANFNSFNGTLTWTVEDIMPESLIEKQFTVRVKEELPENSDLVMATTYNNEVKITVNSTDRVLGVDATNDQLTSNDPFVAPPTGPVGTVSGILATLVTLGAVLVRFGKKLV